MPARRLLAYVIAVVSLSASVGCAGQRTASATGTVQSGALHANAAQQYAPQTHASPTVGIVIETSMGNITVALDSARAPRTVTNFLRYVDNGHFENGQFHRTVTPDNQPRDSVRIEVIQGSVRRMRPDSGFGAITLEPTSVTGLRHADGTISMARAGPHTATSSFFIVIGPQPELDEGGHRQTDGYGFAAFGQVTSGMDIARAIQRAPHTAQNLTPAIAIFRIRRVNP